MLCNSGEFTWKHERVVTKSVIIGDITTHGFSIEWACVWEIKANYKLVSEEI